MNKTLRFGLALSAAAVAVGAQAVTFSNFSVTGNASVIGALGVGHFINTGVKDADISFAHAIIGDPTNPLRATTINITFEVADPAGLTAVSASLNTLALGTGRVEYSEIVEEVSTATILGTMGPLVATQPGGPLVGSLTFSRPSTAIKVKKTIVLTALPDSQALDLAGVGLVEQNFTVAPEPATMVALGLGLVAAARRRRSK